MRCSTLSVFVGLVGAVASVARGLRYQHSPRTRATSSNHSKEFTLAITLNSTYVSLSAVRNGTGLLVLQADETSAYPGTPAYSNQTANTDTGYNTSLVLDLVNSTAYPAGRYGLSVPDLGTRFGETANVVAEKDFQDFGFQIDEDAIYHSLTSASQSWFACLDSVNGTQSYFLKWGVFTGSGSVSDGCLTTNLVQVFNFAGGATKSPWAASGWALRR